MQSKNYFKDKYIFKNVGRQIVDGARTGEMNQSAVNSMKHNYP